MRTLSPQSFAQLWRYYQVGIVNTLFGYGMFALLVAAGLNIYIAQIAAHVMGVTFNYFSYSKHVFREAGAPKVRFILSYAFNYFVGLACLAAASALVASPYVAGLLALLASSLINFVILRCLVFTRTADACASSGA